MGWPMRQELRKSQGSSWFPLLELALPGGGAKRYAYGPGVAALGVGQYDGKLLDISPLPRSLSDRQGSLQDVEYTAEVDDSDGTLSAIIEGSSGRLVRGSTATRRLVSPNVASSWWMTTFEGIVSRYQLTAPRRWQFSIRANDIVLRSPGFPRMTIDATDWPGLPTASASQYGPIIYGKHSNVGTTQAGGAVPLIPLDATGVKFLLQWGWAKTLDRVFSDAVLKVLTSDYTITHPIVNSGRLSTVVTFVVAQGTKAITADVQGLEHVGDGSGALIELTALQIKHLLVNFAVGDWKNGAWLADSTARVDASSFAAHAARYPNAKGSRRILASEKGQPIDELNAWSKSWEARLYWNNQGNIAVAVDPIQQTNIYMDETWLRYDGAQRPMSLVLNPDWDGLISSVASQYQYGESAGKYLGVLEVQDPTATIDQPDSISLPWSAAYVS
jgi:hypothetical protein